MAPQTDAEEEWKIEPARQQRGRSAVGYIYRGEWGTHQGQFVPIHDFPSDAAARVFVDAIKAGLSRREAKAMADQSAA